MSCLLTRSVAWDGSAAGGTTRPPRSALREQAPSLARRAHRSLAIPRSREGRGVFASTASCRITPFRVEQVIACNLRVRPPMTRLLQFGTLIEGDRFAADSALERNGFERSAPRYQQFVASSELGPIYRRTVIRTVSRPRRTDRVVGRGPGRRYSPSGSGGVTPRSRAVGGASASRKRRFESAETGSHPSPTTL